MDSKYRDDLEAKKTCFDYIATARDDTSIFGFDLQHGDDVPKHQTA